MLSVRVNGELLKEEVINYKLTEFINSYKKDNPDVFVDKQIIESLRIELVQNLIDELLIVQYGKSNNLVPSINEVKLEFSKVDYNLKNKDNNTDIINDVTNKLIVNKVTMSRLADNLDYDKALIELYNQNKHHFSMGMAVRLRHILIKVSSEEEALLKIRSALNRVNLGEDFARVAKELSDCPSSIRGGDIGYITANAISEEVESRAFELKKYEISDIFRTEFGFHIIQVLDKVKDYIAPFELVKDKLGKFIYSSAKEQVLAALLEVLREKANIEYIEMG